MSILNILNTLSTLNTLNTLQSKILKILKQDIHAGYVIRLYNEEDIQDTQDTQDTRYSRFFGLNILQWLSPGGVLVRSTKSARFSAEFGAKNSPWRADNSMINAGIG